MWRFLLTPILASLAFTCPAATSVQPLTPANTSVMGGERQVYAVRFFDAFGRAAVGETVSFSNDACGVFDNGAFSMAVVTDASGVASVGFTARPQGITCWITANAGVTATFNVFTYTLGQVSLRGTVYPAEPRPGQPFVLGALASAGAYPIHGARVEARVVPPAAATLSPGSDGGAGRTQFDVTPIGFGAFEIEMTYRGITRRHAVPAVDSPLQDMWWAGVSENGWGLSLVQHGDRVFAAIYVYDAAGTPTWYVIPGGTWNAEHTRFTGSLYAPRSAPYTAYDAARMVIGAPAGTATIAFSGINEATLEYSIGGVAGKKSLTRQGFGPLEATAAPRRVGDMWWGGPSQNGWGLALLQQHRTIFGVWFTYGADGAPTWFVLPSGAWIDDNTWQGRIYRTRGSPWLGQSYDPSRLESVDVGPFVLRFEGDTATFTYAIEGKTGTMGLVRQAF